jgi:hypothetical protein
MSITGRIYSVCHIEWDHMYIYLGFTISFLFSFGLEMGTLCVQLLVLVLGGIPLPPEDILQPLGHGIHQVLQVNIHEVKISLVSTCNLQ